MLSPEERQKIFEEEKTRLEAQEAAKRQLDEKNLRQGCGVFMGCFGVCFLISLLAYAVGLLKETSTGAPDQIPLTIDSAAINIPHEIIDEEVTDLPGKVMVKLHVIATGNVTEPSINDLLKRLYERCAARRGFKHATNPTVVAIYLYASRVHYAGSESSWLAMLTKVPTNPVPTIQVMNSAVAALQVKPEERIGLSEDQRRQIWTQIIQAEDRAWKKADELYPVKLRTTPEALGAYDAASKWLSKKYRGEAFQKHGLTEEQGRSISDEGLRKGWPMPR